MSADGVLSLKVEVNEKNDIKMCPANGLNGRKAIFVKSRQYTQQITCGVKNFIKITLSCTVSKINEFLLFTQKFKMAAKNGRKAIFGKSRQ